MDQTVKIDTMTNRLKMTKAKAEVMHFMCSAAEIPASEDQAIAMSSILMNITGNIIRDLEDTLKDLQVMEGKGG